MKRLIIFGGPNGAGKSTLYREGIISSEEIGERINVDEIAASLGDWRDKRVQWQAARAAVGRARSLIRDGVSFHQESTLSGKTIFNMVRSAKDCGYETELHFVCVLSADIALERVRRRVLAGGHGVDDSDVIRRYHVSLRNVCTNIRLFDYAIFYDNSSAIEPVARFSSGRLTWNRAGVKWFESLNFEE